MVLFPKDGFYRVSCLEFTAFATVREGVVVEEGTSSIFTPYLWDPSGHLAGEIHDMVGLEVTRLPESRL